ncbi:hypothetical protein E4U45_004924 [Claviceps purpurea]|nr:hypothetical protein E4U45_004924 [Claviceps purpurea]
MNTEFETWCRDFGVSKTDYRAAVEKLRDTAEEIEPLRGAAYAPKLAISTEQILPISKDGSEKTGKEIQRW